MAHRLLMLITIALTISLGTTPTSADYEPATRSVGLEVRKALLQVQDHLFSGELDMALGKARETSKTQNLSAYETYIIQSVIASVLINLENYSEAAIALKAALATGQEPAESVPNQVKSIAALHYNAGEYLESIKAGEQLFNITGNEKDTQILVMIAQARFILKDYKATATRIQTAINEADYAGDSVDKRWVLLWIASEYQTGNAAGVALALKEFAKRFPDSNYYLEWRLFPILRGFPPVEM